MRKSAIPRRLKSSRFLLPTDTALRTNGFEFDSLDVDPVKFAISFDFYAGSLADAFLSASKRRSGDFRPGIRDFWRGEGCYIELRRHLTYSLYRFSIYAIIKSRGVIKSQERN